MIIRLRREFSRIHSTDSLKLLTIGKVFLFDSQEVPDTPPYDLYRTSDETEKNRQNVEAGDDIGRQGENPTESKNKIDNHDEIVQSSASVTEIVP